MKTMIVEIIYDTSYSGVSYKAGEISEVPISVGKWLVDIGVAKESESKEQKETEVFGIENVKIGHFYTKLVTTASTSGIMGDVELLTLVQTFLKGFKQPDYPRKLSITGTKADGNLTGNVVIYGMDAFDKSINETIALNDNATVNGTKLFKTITKIVFPVRVTLHDKVKVGTIARSIPLAADNDIILAATALTDEVQEITTGFINPDIPRVLSITGTKAGGNLTGNVIIDGLDDWGNVIQNTIALNDNVTVNGTKSFEQITKITLPVYVADGDTVSIGISNALGLGIKLSKNTVISAYLDGTLESNAPTVAVDPDELSLNTVTLHSALVDGKKVDIYYIEEE